MYTTEVPKSIRKGPIRSRHYLGRGFKCRLKRLGFKTRWGKNGGLSVYCEEGGYWVQPTYLQLFDYFDGKIKDFCFDVEPVSGISEDDLLLLNDYMGDDVDEFLEDKELKDGDLRSNSKEVARRKKE